MGGKMVKEMIKMAQQQLANHHNLNKR
ncbi:hypothetical protein [Caldalkalibacillus uzonensis]